MKNSIDYIDIIDVKIKHIERNRILGLVGPENWEYNEGRLAVLKELREIAIQDCDEHHSKIADQLKERVVNKM